ncbi:hypothetical protein BGX31_007857, partial [Mortierella sp. GBA43]
HQTIQYWHSFVNRFYSPEGTQKFTFVNPSNNEHKDYELAVNRLAEFYQNNYLMGIRGVRVNLDKAIESLSKIPLVVECSKVTIFSDYVGGSKVVTTGAMKVAFTEDYMIDRLEFTAIDFQELIPRPKDDPSSSPSMESKVDSKKKSSAKRSNSIPKGPSQSTTDVPEKLINEFGIPAKMLTKLSVRCIGDEIKADATRHKSATAPTTAVASTREA